LGLNRKRSVHTLPSLPAEGADLPSLMFADRIVVLSECSAIYLRSAGIEDVRVVRPGIPVPETLMPKDELRTRITSSGLIAMDKGHVFLYAGDLEFSNGAETFARAAIETPVIVSDLGPLTELAGLGGGAWVVKQSNPSATANAMIELANDQAKADRLGRAARSTIALNFRPQDMVHRYESIYDELI
jgi:glycosyltransferase involved in cell wall biosynthesis